jgi:reverse transcriptase-like protein
LFRAVYGLKNSPLLWLNTIMEVFRGMGFQQLDNDMCFLVNQKWNAYILLYIDDMIVTAKDSKVIDKVYQKLAENFEVKDLGEAHTFLG